MSLFHARIFSTALATCCQRSRGLFHLLSCDLWNNQLREGDLVFLETISKPFLGLIQDLSHVSVLPDIARWFHL